MGHMSDEVQDSCTPAEPDPRDVPPSWDDPEPEYLPDVYPIGRDER